MKLLLLTILLPIISPIIIHSEGVAQLLFNIQLFKESSSDNPPACFFKEVAIIIYLDCFSVIFQASTDQTYGKLLQLFQYIK